MDKNCIISFDISVDKLDLLKANIAGRLDETRTYDRLRPAIVFLYGAGIKVVQSFDPYADGETLHQKAYNLVVESIAHWNREKLEENLMTIRCAPEKKILLEEFVWKWRRKIVKTFR